MGKILRSIGIVFAFILGLYLLGRALVEPFVINMSTYHNDWGGPSLAGVLAVHCLPGLLLPAWIVWWWLRRRAPRSPEEPQRARSQRIGRS